MNAEWNKDHLELASGAGSRCSIHPAPIIYGEGVREIHGLVVAIG
jgi:hypothetical protein